jgi:hypothetical protein
MPCQKPDYLQIFVFEVVEMAKVSGVHIRIWLLRNMMPNIADTFTYLFNTASTESVLSLCFSRDFVWGFGLTCLKSGLLHT